MISWTRTWQFWALLASLAVGGVYITKQYGAQAIKIINVDVTMTRQEALAKAAQLAEKYQWQPHKYLTAAIFHEDTQTQAFVELEGGGDRGFIDMLAAHTYEPYRWIVRHFHEYDAHEVMISFTPQGTPYGFRVTLPENELLPTISPEEAQKLAQEEAQAEWDIDFSLYKVLETAKKEQPCGRVDHTFVYERTDVQLGAEGKCRLSIVVRGDKVTELRHFVHIPESFQRRYQEARSINNAIQTTATGLFFVLYGLLGLLVGGIFLMRNRLLLTRNALVIGTIMGVLWFAKTLNAWPLELMSYETTSAFNFFVIKTLMQAAMSAVLIGAYTAASMSIAESLTRVSFGHVLQLWKLGTRDSGASLPVVGQVTGGYLGAIFKIGWAMLLYLFFRTVWGWWIPSSMIADPNVMAHYFPPLSPLIISLFAGITEECLFRAVPLAGAALLGRRWGHEKLCIGFGLVIQALIFGGAHANYPTLPGYARVVELFPASIMFGIVYLAYGLLPGILIHWLYDFALMSLPIFVTHAGGVLIYKSFVIAVAIAPLIFIALQRLRVGRWITTLPRSFYNSSWKKSEFKQTEETLHTTQQLALHPTTQMAIGSAGLLGIICWSVFNQWHSDAPEVCLTIRESVAAARSHLKETNPNFLEKASPLTFFGTDPRPDHLFAWRELSKKQYAQLIGTYLTAPHTMVRFVHFEGDLLERAQEYLLHIGTDAAVMRLTHELPEQTPGAHLTEEEAYQKALNVVLEEFGKEPEAIRLINVEPKQRPARIDWNFVFEDLTVPLAMGKALIKVQLLGDQVGDYERSLQIPEEWQRTEQDRLALESIIKLVCFVGWATLLSLCYWFFLPILIRRRNLAMIAKFTAFVSILLILKQLNRVAPMFFSFDTTQSFSSQAAQGLMYLALGCLVRATVWGSLLGSMFVYQHKSRFKRSAFTPLAGLAAGCTLAGAAAVLEKYAPLSKPVWADFEAMNQIIPSIGTALTNLDSLLVLTLSAFTVWFLCTVLTAHWTKRRFVGGLFLIAAVTCIIGIFAFNTLGWLLLAGGAIGSLCVLLYHYVLHKDCTLLPLIMAPIIILDQVREISFNGHPYTPLAPLLSIIAVAAAAYWWFKRLERA